jgi:hypothetical protein
VTFFVLTCALSVPFCVAGALTDVRLLPAIPVSALGLVGVAGAASLLVYREHGLASVAELARRAFDFERVTDPTWYLPAILLMPCIMVLSWVAMRLMGVALSAPTFSMSTPLMLFVVFFVVVIVCGPRTLVRTAPARHGAASAARAVHNRTAGSECPE